MKRDLDTMSITLNQETMYLQLPSFFCDDRKRWYFWNQGPHDHSVYEMHILLKGSAQVRIGDQMHEIRPGGAMIIAPGQYHEAWALEGDFHRFSFMFSPDDKAVKLASMLRRRIPVCLNFRATDAMRELGYQILQDWERNTAYRTEMRQALFQALMINTFRTLDMVGKPEDQLSGELSRMLICDGYFAHEKQNKSTAELARFLCLSERQLHRCLIEYYGMSFQQKLTHSRMEKAAWYLRTTDRHIHEIALDVGYDSESGFFKVFRKHYHVTPLQYRKKYRTQLSLSEEESKI